MTYAEKLKDPRWQKKRLEILNRDKWKCHYCGDEKSTLHVHHEMYFKGKEPWDIPNECLNTVCENCHDFLHTTYKTFTHLEKYLLSCLIQRDWDDRAHPEFGFSKLKNIIKDIKKNGLGF